VFDKEGLLLYSFDNLEMTANFFNVNKHIIKYRLDTGKSLILPFLPSSSDNALLRWQASERVEGQGEKKEVYFKRSISL